MHIEFRRSAFRHGISEERQRHVINYCPVPLYQSAESPADADVLIFLGPDQNGVPLEVAAVDLADGGLRVIPAMRMRDKYQADYERVMKWQGVTVTKSGRRLTEADLDRLADRAERGFDLSTWAPRPGRRPLEAAPAGEHSPRIAVRVPARLHERVTARAEAEGRSVSEVVRGLLEDYARSPRVSKAVSRK